MASTCPKGCGPLPPDRGTCECGTVVLEPLRERDAATVIRRTPLLRSRLVEGAFWKVEGANPTGTFKDRVMSRLVRDAVAREAPGAVVASSGNAAVAAAQACRQADLPLLALVPGSTPDPKVAPLFLRGIPVVRVAGDPSVAYAAARALVDAFGVADLPSTFAAIGTEAACRAIGHEIVADLGEPPTTVSAAISVGPVLVGTGNGVREATGVAGTGPVLLGAQAAGCAPIARAFEEGHDRVVTWEGSPATQAGSIADRLAGYEHEGSFAASVVRSSGGWVRAWPDERLRSARRELAAVDGIDVELASASAVLAAMEWRGPGPVVGVLTGTGARDTFAGQDVPEEPPSTVAFEEHVGIRDVWEVLEPWTR